jgi:HK97 gp10 family phage protein
MATDVYVTVDDGGIRQILASEGARDVLLDAADPIVDAARALAPRRTGAGSASIHAQALTSGRGWTVRVGWTTRRYYMRFQDQGTRGQHPDPARHFMSIALEGAAK